MNTCCQARPKYYDLFKLAVAAALLLFWWLVCVPTHSSEAPKGLAPAPQPANLALPVPSIASSSAVVASSAAAKPAPAPTIVKVFFDNASASVTEAAKKDLAPLINAMRGNPNGKLALSGYHDPSGDLAKNQALAKRRAESIRDLFLAEKIDPLRIELKKPEQTAVGGDAALARRVEAIFTP